MFLSPEIVINAYYKGIFPMADSVDDPFVYWVDPPERGIIELNKFRFSASLKKFINGRCYLTELQIHKEENIYS